MLYQIVPATLLSTLNTLPLVETQIRMKAKIATIEASLIYNNIIFILYNYIHCRL